MGCRHDRTPVYEKIRCKMFAKGSATFNGIILGGRTLDAVSQGGMGLQIRDKSYYLALYDIELPRLEGPKRKRRGEAMAIGVPPDLTVKHSALKVCVTLVNPVDGMDQTKFTMPSPKWFKGKPAKEVRDAEEKEFEKWVAEGAGTQLPVDNTSACSKNLGLRYAASSGLAQSPAPSSQLPPSLRCLRSCWSQRCLRSCQAMGKSERGMAASDTTISNTTARQGSQHHRRCNTIAGHGTGGWR